ncbi:unnamed protein product [Brassica napus]|uniref:(rape) hypothetical protein n=1 Tax=Brassica napus TaxID=3708 RepID=A0A816M0U3_BRANA|nr:unnamed protein product [Brassica napus]
MYPRAASRLLELEESSKDTTNIKPSQSSNASHEAFLHQLENFKNKIQISSKQMDDFAEMENEYNKDSSEAAKVQRNTDEILKTSSHRENQKGFRVCRKADMKKFAEELSSVLEWMANHCFSLQNVSSMREEIKKQFEWDESLSGSDVSSLACKDQWIKDRPVNHKLPSKVMEEEAKDKTESYQVEALEKAMKRNTIVYLETGSGKTLIAIMLLRSYAYLFRKPSPCFSVFLVPQVVLVTQQAEALKRHTDLKVGMYWGSIGVDSWDAPTWKQEVDKYEVLVMTPAILLSALRHSFLTLNMIKVLIFDECHHARGNHAYACILKEFYHKELKSATSSVPRIFGMTASPVKTKGENLDSYWKKIHELESLMNSKVYTCESESVLARFVPFSTPSFKLYQHMEIPSSTRAGIVAELEKLAKEVYIFIEIGLYLHINDDNVLIAFQHLLALATLDLKSSTVNTIKKRLSKICSSITYCLDELGILMALKAAQSFSVSQNDFVLWGQQEKFRETSIKKFCSNASQAILAYIPDGPYWSVANIERNLEAGLITSKILCLVESLLGYRSLEKIRCIIFVERVIAAMVLESFLNEILPTYNSWKTKYVAGNNSGLQSQTRKKQNKTVEDFRKGLVNIIVSTSILEEGLDVQSCNLVVGFDPASNICSFIQSQGRARMPNSDYLMMVESGDMGTRSRLKKYISGAKRMREDSLSHSLVPYQPLPDDSSGEVYRVDSTGAIVTHNQAFVRRIS